MPHALLAAPLAAALALTSTPSAANSDLEETVITATRTPEPPGLLAASVTVLDRADIERSLAIDVGALLSRHIGLEVARNGGPGQAASLFTRGTNSDHTLVLVDGVRINPGTLGGAAIHNIAPETVERIEVIKGPRSTLWGSDAIGGVVNIFTRARAADGLGISLAGGNYGTRSLHIDGGARIAERGHLGFTIGGTDSDGFPTLESSNLDRGYRERHGNLQGEWRATDALTLGAHVWHSRGTSEYLDFFAAPVAQDFRNQALGMDAQWRRSERQTYRVSVLSMRDEIRQLDAEDFVDTHRQTLDLQGDWQLGAGLLLSAGAILNREDTESLSFGTRFDERTRTDQAYLQAQYRRGAQRVALAAGVLDHPAFGGHVTWNAEFARQLSRGFALAVSAGTAFKAPDATDRFGFGANPDLEPERSRQFEISLRQAVTAGQSWQLSLYRNDIDDLINYVVTDFTTFDGRNENIDRARIEGIEFEYRLSGETWSLQLGAALTEPRDLGLDQTLLRRAKQVVSIAAVREFGRLEISADAQAVGARLDFGFPAPTRLDRYTLVNLGAAFAVTPDWRLQLRLDNATDQRYALASGYRTPGRSVMLATRFRFR